MVSLGLVSSSITSSILRPAMPPAALNFSTAHCVALSPLSPALAAIPERGARMPTLHGLACAMVGANTPGAVAPAPAAAKEVRRARRESFMGRPLICWLPSASGFLAVDDISAACQQQRSLADGQHAGERQSTALDTRIKLWLSPILLRVRWCRPTSLDKPHLDPTTPIGRGPIAFLSGLAEDERQRM